MIRVPLVEPMIFVYFDFFWYTMRISEIVRLSTSTHS
jgi:hypothetical protein